MTRDLPTRIAALTRRRRLRRRAAPVAVPLLMLPALLVLAACGTGGPGVANLNGSTPSSGAASGSGNKGQSLEAFSQCMRQHGVTGFPDPGSGGGLAVNAGSLGMDPNSSHFKAAQQACRSHLPNGGQVSPSQQAAMQQAALRFSQCMRAHGIADFPDPQFPSSSSGGGGVRLELPQGIDAQSPQFQAAQSACQRYLPKPPGGGNVQSGGNAVVK